MSRYHVNHQGVTIRVIDADSPGAAALGWAKRDDAIYGFFSKRPKILTVVDTETGVETKWCVTGAVTYTVEKVNES